MENFKQKLTRIKTLLFDVDGVLTNGQVFLMESGEFVRNMNSKDGYALQLAVKKGYRIAIITGGNSQIVKNALHGLGIEDVFLQVEVLIPDENMVDMTALKKIDFKGMFNSVMGMRNNILHQNASPNLTHDTVRKYQIVFESFSKALANVLDANINSLSHIINPI